jgi:hypothetical protein
MIVTYKYEDFVQFTVDMLDDFVRKGTNMAFRGLWRLTGFCNPAKTLLGRSLVLLPFLWSWWLLSQVFLHSSWKTWKISQRKKRGLKEPTSSNLVVDTYIVVFLPNCLSHYAVKFLYWFFDHRVFIWGGWGHSTLQTLPK